MMITVTKATWVEAHAFCKGKDAQLLEPRNKAEMEAMITGLNYVWVNYHDIQLQASIVGMNDSVFVDSVYMGSRSTLEPVPHDMWEFNMWEPAQRQDGRHCGMINGDGMMAWPCSQTNMVNFIGCEVQNDDYLRAQIEKMNDELMNAE